MIFYNGGIKIIKPILYKSDHQLKMYLQISWKKNLFQPVIKVKNKIYNKWLRIQLIKLYNCLILIKKNRKHKNKMNLRGMQNTKL